MCTAHGTTSEPTTTLPPRVKTKGAAAAHWFKSHGASSSMSCCDERRYRRSCSSGHLISSSPLDLSGSTTSGPSSSTSAYCWVWKPHGLYWLTTRIDRAVAVGYSDTTSHIHPCRALLLPAHGRCILETKEPRRQNFLPRRRIESTCSAVSRLALSIPLWVRVCVGRVTRSIQRRVLSTRTRRQRPARVRFSARARARMQLRACLDAKFFWILTP